MARLLTEAWPPCTSGAWSASSVLRGPWRSNGFTRTSRAIRISSAPSSTRRASRRALRHPHVVPILDVQREANELFLILEYVIGESLWQLVRSARALGEPVPPDIATSVMIGALHGLHAAHEAVDEAGNPLGIVHRDVSPQNVLVGTDGVARVLDFGVAKAASRLQTTERGKPKEALLPGAGADPRRRSLETHRRLRGGHRALGAADGGPVLRRSGAR